jgi:peptidoglycan/xylan/chitin deacetylase (PgdA/CDA1 family)
MVFPHRDPSMPLTESPSAPALDGPPPGRLSHRAVAGVATAVLAGAGAVAPLVVVLTTPADLGALGPVVVVAATLAAWATARRLPPPTLAVTGAALAALAAWLVSQRPDVGSAALLGALFGAGAGFAAPRDWRRRVTALSAVAMTAALVVLRVIDARPAALTFAVVVVAAGAVTTRVVHRGHASRALTFAVGVPLVVAALLLTAYFGASTPAAAWFGGGATHGARDSNLVALTFDDGPNLATTPAVMQILDAAHVQGTFFIVGKALDAAPIDADIVKALVAHGHLVGNHSYQHDQWRWLDPRYPELERTQRAFARDVGVCPAWYRPPHGQRTPFLARVVHDHHMHMALWDVSASDWTTTDAHLVARRVLAKVRGGSIIDLHDGLDGNPYADRSVVARALPEILAGLRAKGLQPVRLDQLLHGAAYVPCPHV